MIDETNPISEQLHLGPHLPQTYGATGETCRQRLSAGHLWSRLRGDAVLKGPLFINEARLTGERRQGTLIGLHPSAELPQQNGT